ncbi:hypothetical protein BST97_07680 [Nonlabens spongiae]|uniref:Peptidase M56 domain-containing protein n=2 Tax=Nonlabens spongiae TaxID=331648 RepID=A0A1W6MJV9_9FLAO|nr:hypothetical protein BST97_07680 [Nonlabens spongiae]
MWIIQTSLLKKYRGMTLFPLLLVSHEADVHDEVFINHERIHAAQQKELLIIFFYLWYVINYLLLRTKYDHHQAYRNIVFEREAYAMERNLNYLTDRKWWSFLKFYHGAS